MQSPSLNTYADYETQILPTSESSCQTPLITNRKSQRNFLIVTTSSIFDSALEHERSKGCRPLQIFAQNTECWQNDRQNLTSYKKLHCNRPNRFLCRNQASASTKPRSTS